MNILRTYFQPTHYRIHSYHLREDRLLSEGGYAYLYVVRDTATGKRYALKKMKLVDKERVRMGE